MPGPFDSYYNDPRWSSLYGYVPPPRGPGMFGMDGGGGSGMFGGAMQSLMPMVAEMFRGQLGGFGFNFGSDMNIAASEYARQFVQQLNQARSAGAVADTSQVNDLLRGMAVMIGHEPIGKTAWGQVMFNPATEMAMGRMASDASAMLPILASMFPDTVDKFFPRGSMTVASTSFVNAGRFIVDPATGDSIANDPQYGVRVLGSLLDRGPKATAGLGAGRLGQLFEQLTAQGFVSSGNELGALVKTGVLTGDQARGIQADRITSQIENYSQVVAAINDIFAESGRPNAPMAELIRGLQTLTQGGMGSYNASDLARIVRTTQGAAQLSGMGFEQLVQMSVASGAALQRYGAHAAYAAPVATYTAAVGAAYANAGFGGPSMEGMGRDAFTRAYADSLAAGMGSEQMNLFGALAQQAKYAAPGSALAAVGDALRSGKTTVNVPGVGEVNLLNASTETLQKLFSASGLDPTALLTQLSARNQNKGAFSPDTAMALTRAAQSSEAMAAFSSANLELLAGGDPAEMARIVKALSDASGETSDAGMAMAAAKALGKDSAWASRVGPELTRAAMASRFSSGFEMFRAYTRMGGAEDLYESFGARGADYAALTHLGRGGMLRNITNAIKGVGMGDDPGLLGLAAKGLLGMVDAESVRNARLAPLYDAMKGAFPGVMGLEMMKSFDTAMSMNEYNNKNNSFSAVLDAILPGAGGATSVALAEGKAGKGAKAKEPMTLEATIGKLEITAGADGALAGFLKIAGTMTGGGTAIPPAGP